MPIERIPLSQPIDTRDGTLTKDAKCTNGYFETVGQKRSFIKRPGVSILSNLPAAKGQGLFYFEGVLYAIVNNILYSVSSTGVYTTIGTMTGAVATAYFNQNLPTPAATNTITRSNYIFSVPATNMPFTVPSGITVIYVTLIGAGGGGSADDGTGDSHPGSGGGSGGHIDNQAIIVIPGSTLYITVGSGGLHSQSSFNGVVTCASGSTGTYTGGTGGSSSISGTGFTTLTATGGTGGLSPGYMGAGAGGTPNGTVGTLGVGMNNGMVPGVGGINGTGYGAGGNGALTYANTSCPGNGGAGAVLLSF